MKRITLIAILISGICVSAFARKFVAEGKTYSAFGNYAIEVDDNFISVNGKMHKPYVITYENSNLEIRVAIDMDRGIKTYYVMSDPLSVQYVSNRHYFGIEKLSKDLDNVGLRTSEAALNMQEYFHQKVITSGRSWRRDNTQLIAAFFPMLLNDQETRLAVK